MACHKFCKAKLMTYAEGHFKWAGSPLYFRGDNSKPTAFVEVKVYGRENPKAFDALTGEICKIFGDVLNIPADHIYVKYEAVSNWGWNGSNF